MKSCVSTIHTPVHAPVVQERVPASPYAPLSRHQQEEGGSAVISIQFVISNNDHLCIAAVNK